MKKFGFILFFAIFPFGVFAWESCGENSNCVYNIENGVLTIRGTGTNGEGHMPAYNYFNDDTEGLGGYATTAPWFSSRQEITSVKIEKGIDNVGAAAFMNITLTSVELPDNLKSIDGHAFWYSGLTEINIPNSVETIGDYAIEHNPFTSLVIPDSVTSIGDYALSQLSVSGTVLEDIYVGSGIDTIGTGVLSGSYQLKNVYCSKEKMQECAKMLSDSGKTEQQVAQMLKTYEKTGNRYVSDSKVYRSLSDMQKGVSVKRIYSVQEANMAAGKKNKVMIRYK